MSCGIVPHNASFLNALAFLFSFVHLFMLSIALGDHKQYRLMIFNPLILSVTISLCDVNEALPYCKRIEPSL